MKKFRSEIRSGEILAVRHDPRNLAKSRSDILNMLMADPVVENDDRGGAIIVTIRGTLEQNACGYGDSYQQIRARWMAAVGEAPDCIILKIDSGGGAVAGLNQLVYDMRAAAEESGIHVVAYLDEMAASAAYAIATVADEIVLPPSGMAGSIGVISFMVDTVEADAKAGLNWVTLTSGDRKDDGHPHTTITRAAANAEQERVDELGGQFFALVKERRGVDAQPLQAALFLGQAAVEAGLADDVVGWEQLLVDTCAKYGTGEEAVAQVGTPEEGKMDALKALIAQTRKALASAVTTGKRAELTAQLSAYESTLKAMKKTKYVKEEETSEESDDHEDEDKKEGSAEEESDEDASASEDDEKKEKKSKKAKAEEDEKKESVSEEDEEASAEEDDDEKEASALLKSPGRAAAVITKARAYDALQDKVAKLEAKSIKQDRDALIRGAKLPPALAKRLASKPLAYVRDFIKDMRGTPLASLSTEDDALTPRNYEDRVAGSSEGFSERQLQIFRTAAAQMNRPLEDVIKDYRMSSARPNGQRSPNVVTKEFVESHRSGSGGN